MASPPASPANPKPRKLYTLQVYRALAAIFVVLYHANAILRSYFSQTPLSEAFEAGHSGVQFFFVLSGFIIWWVHAKDIDTGKVRAYAWRRAIRIYPVYIIITLALVPVWFSVPSFGGAYHRQLVPLLLSLLLIPQSHPPHLAVAWTLNYEIAFYALFGVLIASRRIGLALGFGLAFGAVCALLFWPHRSFPLSFVFGEDNLLFLFGVAAAYAAQRFPRLQGRIAIVLLLAGTGAFALLAAAETVGVLQHHPVFGYGVAAAVAMLGATNAQIDRFFANRKILCFLGDASYSIYLLHLVVLSAFAKVARTLHVPGRLGLNGLFIVLVVIGVSAGALLYIFVERPLLRKLRKKVRPARPTGPAVS